MVIAQSLNIYEFIQINRSSDTKCEEKFANSANGIEIGNKGYLLKQERYYDYYINNSVD